MSLSRIQKIAIALFIGSFLPAYLMAQWRYDANISSIQDKFERERNLHLSTDKLLVNCERNEKKENTAYDANHRICDQGLKTHELTSQAMSALDQENTHSRVWWYVNFLLSVLVLNFLSFAIYKGKTFLKREEA